MFDVELDDGRRMSFHSRLFTSSELRSIVGAHFEIEHLRGLDLFHAGFAPDPIRFSSGEAAGGTRRSKRLSALGFELRSVAVGGETR